MKRPTIGWRVTLLIEKLANNIGFRIQENYCEEIKPMKIEDWESASSMPMRKPSVEESQAWAGKLHPIEVPAGSVVVFGDHVWYGSFPRTVPGHRMMILCEYARPRLQMQEPFRDTVTQEILDRNPIRFSGLMDVYGPFPFGKSDRQRERADLNNSPWHRLQLKCGAIL